MTEPMTALPRSSVINIPEVYEFVEEREELSRQIRAAHNTLEAAAREFETIMGVTDLAMANRVTGIISLLVGLLITANGNLSTIGVTVTESTPFLSRPTVDKGLSQPFEAFRSLVRAWDTSQFQLQTFLSQRNTLNRQVFLQTGKEVIEQSEARPGEAAKAMRFLHTRAKSFAGTEETLSNFEKLVQQLASDLPRGVQLFSSHESEFKALAQDRNSVPDLPSLTLQVSSLLLD